MSIIDQCPSTTKGPKAKAVPDSAPQPGRIDPSANGRSYWRSLEEYSGTGEFKEFVEREFPAGASELLGASRRDMLKLMGAGLAIAGAATIPGCRRPDLKILPYSRSVPEHVVPGKALFYATSLPLPGGGAEGVLAETHEGRPTRLEGNPLHPQNRGKSSTYSQARVLDLYDPDRLTQPMVTLDTGERRRATWDDFRANERGLPSLNKFDATRGRGLAIVVEATDAPTRAWLKTQVLNRWSQAVWIDHDPMQTGHALAGLERAFGRPTRAHADFSKAKVILSLDDDFLGSGPDELSNNRGFARHRTPAQAGDEMSRLYMLESTLSQTGMSADHRFRMSPSRVTTWAVEIARAVFRLGVTSSMNALALAIEQTGPIPAGDDCTEAYAEMIAKDLADHPGTGLIVAGDSQPAGVHALVAALNQALGNNGKTVSYTDAPANVGRSSAELMTALAQDIRSGVVTDVVCVNCNPAYDAPAGANMAEAMAKARVITWHTMPTETGALAQWELNGTHDLEAWGDSLAWDGTIAPRQPMIAPLFDPALSDIEFLAMLAGLDLPNGQVAVRRAWGERLGMSPDSAAFERVWTRTLHDGVLAGSAPTPRAGSVNVSGVTQVAGALPLSPMPTDTALEVRFTTGRVGDGRMSNNGWLQEMPQIGSMVVWDNPAIISPATAKKLTLEPRGGAEDPYTRGQLPRARMAILNINGTAMDVPVWITPGVPDNTVILTVGYGRSRCGRVGLGVGVNTYGVYDGEATATGATLDRKLGSYEIASTQNHWSLEGRTSIVRAIDKKWWDKHATDFEKKPEQAKIVEDKIYGVIKTDPNNEVGVAKLNLAEQLGELTHTPDNVSIYTNPQNRSGKDPAFVREQSGALASRREQPDFAKGPQWGMTIDMSSCTGCGVCIVACQSENNIPIVGKRETAKGREMQWIRVDRYFVGDDLNEPDEVLNQPVACVHCENAPCEVVCPVNATVHGPEGTNNMAYNRCIGTRYCSNNCPYKVRRFNFFDYGQVKFNGGFIGDELAPARNTAEQAERWNVNFIPPRLREKLDEISKMQMNPNVTVRGRGVMEKCTYCIQRVNAARHESKIRGLDSIPDGFFQVACQQACPSDSITFGDILDEASAVSKTRASQRSFLLLGYLNTRPRTSHMLRVRNPYEPLLKAVWQDRVDAGRATAKQMAARLADPFEHGSGHGGEYGDEHGGEAHGGEAHSTGLIDPARKRADDGYAISLRVLGDSFTSTASSTASSVVSTSMGPIAGMGV